MACTGARVVDGALIVSEGFRAHVLVGRGVPVGGVSVDETLGGPLGLCEEEPVIPRGCEPGVAVGKRFADRNPVHQGHPAHGLRVVHGQPLCHTQPAVMTCGKELLMPERLHKMRAVAGHRALGVRRVIWRRRGLG